MVTVILKNGSLYKCLEHVAMRLIKNHGATLYENATISPPNELPEELKGELPSTAPSLLTHSHSECFNNNTVHKCQNKNDNATCCKKQPEKKIDNEKVQINPKEAKTGNRGRKPNSRARNA